LQRVISYYRIIVTLLFTLSEPITPVSLVVDPSMHHVIWTRALRESVPQHPDVTDDMTADLVVVGGGLCGLATSLHDARGGLSVILLEAAIVGGGAAGRNTGFVIPQFPGGLTPSGACSLLGQRKGESLAELVDGGADAVFAQIRDLHIQCDAQQGGWIQPAHSAKSLRSVRSVYEEWRALGKNVEWLETERISALIGSAGYLGGWINSTGGTVNPYGLSLGLARVAARLVARIFEHSRADRYESDHIGTSVHVGRHRIRARKVIVATNGYSDGSLPTVQRSVIPVHLFQVATRPLSRRQLQSILPTRACYSDLRKSGGFGRLDADNRLITGGAVFALRSGKAYGLAHASNRLTGQFPVLADAKIEFDSYWEGYCAVTETRIPHVHILGNGFISVGGFSTRGVNLAQNIGRVLGEFAADRRTLDEIPLEVRDARGDIPLWSMKRCAARIVFPMYKAMDRLGLS
jgi:glycine/D-amino acid oxidase-like deaminating enzyme